MDIEEGIVQKNMENTPLILKKKKKNARKTNIGS